MKTWFSLLAAIILLASPFAAKAADGAKAGYDSLPGKQIAQQISLLTGVAISPLLGVSAVGCWEYCHAKTDAEKAKLHWFANPLFWFPALLLVLACFAKDTAGTALPTAVKKPLDVVETVEHKISGLVATGAFVPIAVSMFSMAHHNDGAMLAGSGFAAIDGSSIYSVLMTPVAMIAFFIVFLASNAINILILLSPFTVVDAALKGVRAAILASVAGTALMNPWIGAAWALGIIIVSYFIAGWSFRLSHFGIVFIWEFLSRRCKRFTPDNTVNRMFLARKINKVPSRTYGKLTRDASGKFIFEYHPWLVLPQRTLVLPADGQYAVGKGLFYSEILHINGDVTRSALLLPPRYRGHEEQLVNIYRFVDVRDTGLRATWRWIRGLFGMKPREAVAAA